MNRWSGYRTRGALSADWMPILYYSSIARVRILHEPRLSYSSSIGVCWRETSASQLRATLGAHTGQTVVDGILNHCRRCACPPPCTAELFVFSPSICPHPAWWIQASLGRLLRRGRDPLWRLRELAPPVDQRPRTDVEPLKSPGTTRRLQRRGSILPIRTGPAARQESRCHGCTM